MRYSDHLLWRLLAALVLIAGAGWIWVSRSPAGSTTAGANPAPQQGFLAPDFSLLDSAGGKVTLSLLRGKPVIINFWASWCPPCRAEMPALQRVFEEFQARGLVILAVNAADQDDRTAALAFVQINQLGFNLLFDQDGEVSRRYNVRSLPTTFFVDAQGKIQEVVIGGPMSDALLWVRVEQLFKSAPLEIP